MLAGKIEKLAKFEISGDVFSNIYHRVIDKKKFFIIAAAIIACGYLVVERQMQREAVYSSSGIYHQIQQRKVLLKNLRMSSKMASLADSWKRILLLSKANNVKVLSDKDPKKKAYQGAAAAWHGYLKGDAIDVVSTILAAQKVAPVYLGYIQIVNGKAALSFSVTGAKL